MRVFYTDIFVLPLPEKHKFPMDKYRLTRERLLSEGVLSTEELLVPPAADESSSWYTPPIISMPSYPVESTPGCSAASVFLGAKN